MPKIKAKNLQEALSNVQETNKTLIDFAFSLLGGKGVSEKR